MTQSEKEIQDVLDKLAVLEPGATDAPRPAAQALAALKQRVEPARSATFVEFLRSLITMSNRRTATVLATLVITLGIAFSFPAVRTAASEFLSLFRVQKFAAVSISPEQIALLEQVAEQGLKPGEFEIDQEPGALTPVNSLDEAASVTGMTPRTLRSLGTPEAMYVVDGGSGRLTINLANARAILEATGVDPMLLPDSLDGARVDVATFPGVEQHWPDGTMLLQSQSPIVNYPADLNPAVLGSALLQVLGLDAAEADRLAQKIDWTSTLLLPVPQDFATFSEVSVDGVSGLALNSVDAKGGAILWQKDGVVYLLIGAGQRVSDLVDLAGSLR